MDKITPFWPTPPLSLNDEGNRRFTVIDPAAADCADIEPLRVLLTDDATAVERVKARLDELTAKINITALPRGGVMLNGSANQLRNYIMRDIEITEKLKKDFETDRIIDEALAMQRRGRPAPLPRPTYLAVAIRAIYDDIESWSRP